MSGVTKKLISASGGVAGGEFTAIEDVFSCFLYTGNSSTQTITNGIDLAGEGGLVWSKRRSGTNNHILVDTERGAGNGLRSNAGSASISETSVIAFNSDGYDLGSESAINFLDSTNVSWTFRKAPRFFDVVTYTGTGSAQTIAHNLGTTVGSMLIKRTDSSGSWVVYHRGLNGGTNAEQYFIFLNATTAQQQATVVWNDTAPTDSVFTVGANVSTINASGGTYVAYLFAHDPLGPSGDGSDGLIDCGSLSISSQATVEVDLGWETQFVMLKPSSTTGNWFMFDTMRGMAVDSFEWLYANTSDDAEVKPYQTVYPTPTGFGFNPANNGQLVNGTYIYIAIRRGPMRAPESGTEVFGVISANEPSTSPLTTQSGVLTDTVIHGIRVDDGGFGPHWLSRLTNNALVSSSTNAESSGFWKFDNNEYAYIPASGFANNNPAKRYVAYSFRRAPEFFDVVAYTGDGVTPLTVPHNLGVAPELMIVKGRSRISNWFVYSSALGPLSSLILNLDFSEQLIGRWGSLDPTSEVFTVSSTGTNKASDTYIAYLFASLAGVSKVGSYTGNGTSQTINCGFTTGARFILIKRTDSTGDWYVWDTARGIVAGNDPFLELNTTDAEVTSDDSIDPDSSGFIVNQTGTTNVNVSSASYIFYAIS